MPHVAPAGEPTLCVLAEQDAQCLAARNSALANLLLQEAEAVTRQSIGWRSGASSTSLSRDLLLLSAAHQRNLDAAAAIEIHLRLVEAEGAAGNIRLRLQEFDDMLSDLTRMEEHGMVAPVSRPEIEGQKLELRHRQVELQATIQQLNLQLAGKLKLELPSDTRFWPETSLAVDVPVPDRDEAVIQALVNRADLASWRLASSATGRDVVLAAQVILPQIGQGLLASTTMSGPLRLLDFQPRANEAPVRSEQLSLMFREREHDVRQETLQGVVWVETRLAQIDLTRARLDFAHARSESLQQQQQLTAGPPFILRRARLEVLAVEQDLLRDVIEWKLALMRLRRTQGMLAVECGFGVSDLCGDCCP